MSLFFPNGVSTYSPNFHGHLTHIVGDSLIYFKTTGFHRAGHAVETMDSDNEAPELLSEDIP